MSNQAENEKLTKNISDQLDRLMKQLKDLEEYKCVNTRVFIFISIILYYQYYQEVVEELYRF